MAFTSQKFIRALNQSSPRLGDALNDLTGNLVAVPATSATAGTTSTVAHGLVDHLGVAKVPRFAHVTRGNIYIVSIDATNVTVASTGVSQTGEVRVVGMAADNYLGPRKLR